jgi:hypothetical protein
MLLLLGSALLATSVFAGVNITINPFEIAQAIHEATQSTPGRVYQSKPAATRPAQKTRPKSRSSSTPSPETGQWYEDGRGVPKNYAEVVNGYRKAADQNDPVAQYRLAHCYYFGKGIPKNYVECYKGLLLSAAQGDERARKAMPIVERAISRNEIAEGQSLARDFKPGEIPPTGTAVSEMNLSEARPIASGTAFFITEDGYPVTNKHQDVAQAAKVVNQQPETQPETTATSETTTTPQAAPAQPERPISWREVDAIYNLESKKTRLQKDALWSRFKGKKVRWTGKVSHMSEGWFGGLSMQVKMNRDTFTSDLIIDLDSSQKDRAMQFEEGDTVRFTGILREWGTLMPITIEDGEILN